MLSFNVFLFYINSDTIDGSLEELTKLIIRLDKDPKKTRKQQNIDKKIREILVPYKIQSSMRN